MSRILIVGKGAIGTFLGVAFQSYGHEVKHLVRDGSSSARQVRTAVYDLRRGQKWKSRNYFYDYTSDASVAGGFDFIFLPIGNHELRSVLEVVVPNLRPDQYLVLSGNLWDGFDYLENNIPGRYVLAFPHFGGAITEGTLSGWLTRNLSLGYISAENSKQLEQLKAFFESNGFKPKIRPDLKEWMLTHFAWNTGIMTEAYVQGGFRNMLRRFRNLKRAYYITREAMQVVKLLGVDYLRFEEGRMSEKPVWLNAIKVALLFKMSRIARIFDAAGNIPEWKSYGRSVLITSREKNLYLPYLEYYSELLV